MSRSILAFALVFVSLSVALLVACGRHSSVPSASAPDTSSDRPGTVAQIARASRPGHPVLFVGLDGADWQLLDDYIARGVMPNLARLVREGVSGVVETLRPPLSPSVWTSMMTGVSPLEHGVLDFVQFDPQTGAKEPITSSVRRA